MYREIKFRGMDILGDWYYGALSADGHHIVRLHTDKRGAIRELYQDIDPSTLGQYTGCKDINGKDIYEGDIIIADGCIENTAEIIYDERECAFRGVGHYRSNGQLGWMVEHCDKLQVLGNIYENRNLLS